MAVPGAREGATGACASARRRPGGVDFELYPWILSNEKVKETLDWTPRYSSRETFEIAMRAQGRLEPDRGERVGSVAEDLDRREAPVSH